MRTRLFTAASRASLALALGLLAQPALAQDEPSEVEEVVVTGSYIAGTPEDAAVPVDVVTAQTLEEQGSPTMVQMVKTMSGVGSGVGESNRYLTGAGTASVNLRGFGASRTLSLFNGRRMADTTQATSTTGVGGGADLSFIPTAAIGRIEVLKEGAAAIYGSDAVGGVVNFITRKDLDGFEVAAQYAFIDGSDGDYEASIAWGHTFDAGNVLLTAGYRRRSVLPTLERDWALIPYEQGPAAGWTIATSVPNYLRPNGTNFPAGAYLGPDGVLYSLTTAQPIRDNGCPEMGGVLTVSTTNGAPVTTPTPTSACRFQFTPWNDLVNDEYHYQLYGEVNFEFSENLAFHGEAMWALHEVPRQRISPSNATTNFPTAASLGGTSGATATPSFNFQTFFFVPANNPGYQATFNWVADPARGCMAPLTRAQCAAALSVPGMAIPQASWRPISFSGDPNTPDGGGHQSVEADAYRVSGGFRGTVFEAINFDTALTYMETQSRTSTPDILTNRLQNALNGFASRKGDANQCELSERTPANAGNAAAGCYWFNPFANAQTIKLQGGAATPFTNPAVLNDPLVLQWLYESPLSTLTNRLFVADAVFSGELPITLPGGTVAYAVGGQWRKRTFIGEYSELNNSQITPCVDSIDDGTPVCVVPTGPLNFNAPNENYNDTDDVWALFAETRIPVLENLEFTLAIRHEDHGDIGTTTNPKVAARWQPLDWLTFRGSASTTFRAPTPLVTTPREQKGVANLGGTYRAVITANNPDLQPETATTYNVGFVVELGGFTGSLDYYKFDFEDELTVETAAQIFNQASLLAASPAACNDPGLAPLKARFVYSAGGGVTGCDVGSIITTQVNIVNGPDTTTSGLDARAQYDWDEVDLFGWGEGLSAAVGLEATYLFEFQRGDFSLLGADDIVFQPAVDRAGRHDLLSTFISYPKLRGTAFASLSAENWSLRWQILYHEGTTPLPGTSSTVYFNGVAVTVGKSEDFWQHDVILRYELPWDTVATFSVQNVFDRDPPFKHSQFNYDYTAASPLGRVFEIGLKKRF
ncbi:TonB-dependent receptor domain-containing protein [Phenylobacterium sp.]|uniref:TonB-dependent receptor domain-containing protein n=1 Tax=Phenylobacterium sp. TaxID=1871053 RepID=UPI002E2F94F8|nr:TonB-dependent receptor [Phenylobacterium sp.]HEX2562205.1 TonB-dependent receptor [Phenylobacterium sp.]